MANSENFSPLISIGIGISISIGIGIDISIGIGISISIGNGIGISIGIGIGGGMDLRQVAGYQYHQGIRKPQIHLFCQQVIGLL